MREINKSNLDTFNWLCQFYFLRWARQPDSEDTYFVEWKKRFKGPVERCIMDMDFQSRRIFAKMILDSIPSEPKTELPNGLNCFLETHFEIVQGITLNEESSNTVKQRREAQGTGGLYELAKELSIEFETKNAARAWDGEFFEEIEDFLNEKL